MNRALHLLLSLIHTEERTGLLLLVFDTTTVVTLAWQDGEIVSTHAGVLEGQAVLDLLARPGRFLKRWRWFDRSSRGLQAARVQPTLGCTSEWLMDTATIWRPPGSWRNRSIEEGMLLNDRMRRIQQLLGVMAGEDGHALFKRHLLTNPPEADWEDFTTSIRAPMNRWFGTTLTGELTGLK